ncbi:hypothetical protein L1987_71399 [Smallanthus sonchifolius]|uniref:Uncharacterized protein n=1 Tax=Smallanthus sonchifolius TaxID=185202 RepID=A0ACB9ATX7_9ASTR|nr:hypothetical protein L1987_71399 [Smallanthus sonchifolius]
MMNLTLLESANLTEVMRKKMGINDMPIMAVMMPGMGLKSRVRGGGSGGGVKGGEEKATEKTTFDLKLEGGFDSGESAYLVNGLDAVRPVFHDSRLTSQENVTIKQVFSTPFSSPPQIIRSN